MAVAPFVTFLMKPTSNISSTPTIVFGNDVHTCIVDGFIISNKSPTSQEIYVTIKLAREITIGVESYFTLANSVSLAKNANIDIMLNASLTLQAGDLLYASSSFSSDLFDIFVSYRELLELPQT